MTTSLPFAAMRRARSKAAGTGGLALALALLAGPTPAAAQAPTNPPPPAPVGTRAPTLPPPPPSVAPSRGAAPATAASVGPAPVAAALRAAPVPPGLPPDSVRPAASTTIAAPPANAVAQCNDGTFIVSPAAPAACSGHRGLLAVLPQRTPPPTPIARVTPAPVALTAAASNAPPPAGATMRCKDGSYLGGTPSESACMGRGGLAMVLPASPTPPPARPGTLAPARPGQAAPAARRPAAAKPAPTPPSQP